MIKRHILKKVSREDLFLNPQKQDPISPRVRETAQAYSQIRGPVKTYKLHNWLNDWQENNER